MVMVNLDDTIYENLKQFLKDNNIEYPTLKNFVDRSVKEKLKIELIQEKEESN